MTEVMINTNIKDTEMNFRTTNDVFSPQGIDAGTLAMLSIVDFHDDDKLLDLGCGYGIVGILAAKIIGENNVVMTDKNIKAVELAKQNSKLNNVSEVKIYQCEGFKDLNEKDFTLILSNPPYHVDFNVPKEFIEKGFNRLTMGGKMYMVTKRKEWYKNKLVSIFGGVKITEIGGYYVFMAVKKDNKYANVKAKEVKKIKKTY